MKRRAQPTTEAGPELRVSQIIVQLVLVNEHDAPVRPEPNLFEGTAAGTAAENLSTWLGNLPEHLAAAADAQFRRPTEEPAG